MADRERDEDSGRYTDKYPSVEILSAISELGGQAATSEIAERIESSRDSAYKKLQMMEDRGQVESRKAGGIRVWSAAESGV